MVGTGFGGIAAGVNLKLGRNLTNFIIIEKSYGVGGTVSFFLASDCLNVSLIRVCPSARIFVGLTFC